MLVVVDGDRSAVGLEDGDALLEELVAGIELLPLVVAGILSVLGDDENGIHGKLRSAATEGLCDGGVDLESEFSGPVGTLIVLGSLVDVEGYDTGVWSVPDSLARPTDQKTVGEVLGVREVAVDGRDDCDSFWLCRCHGWDTIGPIRFSRMWTPRPADMRYPDAVYRCAPDPGAGSLRLPRRDPL